MKRILLLTIALCGVGILTQAQTKKVAYQLFANGPVVKLYKMNNATGKYVLTDSINNSPFTGTFTNLDTGTYLLRAVYNGSKYIPTFYPNKAFWTEASTLVLTAAVDSVYGYIDAIPTITNPGIASVIGQLTEGMMKMNAPGDKMANIQVNLVDSVNRVLGLAFTDANGNFTFNNINFGTYKVKPEIVNVTFAAPAQVQVTPLNPNITINLTVNNNGFVYTSVKEVKQQSLQIYPNPLNDQCRVQIPGYKGNIHVELSDLKGKVVLTTDIRNEGELNANGLPAGIYLLRWASATDTGVIKAIKQ